MVKLQKKRFILSRIMDYQHAIKIFIKQQQQHFYYFFFIYKTSINVFILFFQERKKIKINKFLPSVLFHQHVFWEYLFHSLFLFDRKYQQNSKLRSIHQKNKTIPVRQINVKIPVSNLSRLSNNVYFFFIDQTLVEISMKLSQFLLAKW